MQGYRLRGNERGPVLLFMLGTLLVLLVFGGFAIDLAFYSTTKGELQRSMDAAALAGAGNLGFDDTVFPTVRQRAWDFANLNPTRANLSTLNPTGAINLDQNPGNDPTKDIVLGVWDGTSFTVDDPLDASTVNAVKCQYATNVPTSFLGILGINILPVSAQAIAVANPAANPGPTACVAPIGVNGCGWEDPDGFNSQGCGKPLTFISSSTGTPEAGTNSAAWTNFIPALPQCEPEFETCCDPEVDPDCPAEEQFAWKEYLTDAINNIADNTCAGSTASVNNVTDTNNGLIQNVVDLLETVLVDKYMATSAAPDWIPVTNADGDVIYNGPGWKLTVAVIKTACPEPGAITGDHTIIGWTEFVMTQVINHGNCAVANSADANTWSLCPPPMNENGAPRSPSLRAVYGYLSCELIESPPTSDPAPRSSIASGRKLVQ